MCLFGLALEWPLTAPKRPIQTAPSACWSWAALSVGRPRPKRHLGKPGSVPAIGWARLGGPGVYPIEATICHWDGLSQLWGWTTKTLTLHFFGPLQFTPVLQHAGACLLITAIVKSQFFYIWKLHFFFHEMALVMYQKIRPSRLVLSNSDWVPGTSDENISYL